MSIYFEQYAHETDFKTSESWVVLSPIEKQIKKKIEAVGTPLKEWDININYGIKTGFNEAFIITGEKRKELIEEDPKSAEIIGPILRGRDIKKYSNEFADLWLIFVPWHFPLHNDKSIKGASEVAEDEFKRQYPAIYNHLSNFKQDLSNRNKAETGIRYEWYALQRWGANYWEDFFKQKIVYIEIMTDNPDEGYDFPCFSYDEENSIALNTAYVMTGDVKELKYILSVLNSKLGKQLVKYYVVQLQQRQYRMLGQYVSNFPIPKLEGEEYYIYDNLVTKILARKKNKEDFKDLEEIIKNKIYNIFNLNQEEIDFIELQ